MTIDDAIKGFETFAELLEVEKDFLNDSEISEEMEKQKQFAEWLKDYKRLKEQEPCEDSISRQAVLDIAKSSKSNWIDNSILFKRVNELPSVTLQEPRWIPVSERLPKEHICDDGYHEPSEYVLVQMKSGLMHVARYWTRLDSRWIGIPNPTTDRIVAWMPLPQTWKGQKE